MPIQLTTLSQSSLQDYNDCPRRFELRYLQQLAYPAIETEPALENEKHQRKANIFTGWPSNISSAFPPSRLPNWQTQKTCNAGGRILLFQKT
jgi:hypothetical protein